jgi:hypothetical protein
VIDHHDKLEKWIGDERRHRRQLGLALVHLFDRDVADETKTAGDPQETEFRVA